MWPYGLNNLLRMQSKWAEIIKVYMANHMPPKMACLIGNIWNIFAPDHREEVGNLLTLLIFKEWIKKMLKLVMINSGAIYQMDQTKKQVTEYFINLLCERIWINKDNQMDELQAGFVSAYQSLGDYVEEIGVAEKQPFLLNLAFDFQCISFSNLVTILTYFQKLDIKGYKEKYQELRQPEFSDYKMKNLLRVVDVIRRKKKRDIEEENLFLTFTKKETNREWEKLLKKDISTAREYFDSYDGHSADSLRSYQAYFETLEKVKELAADRDEALVQLLSDYLRHMDSNYIDHCTSYFKDNFTLSDLLKTDQTNKMFARVTHLKMISGMPQYSAQVAVAYLVQKMSEEEIEIYIHHNKGGSRRGSKRNSVTGTQPPDFFTGTTTQLSDDTTKSGSDTKSDKKIPFPSQDIKYDYTINNKIFNLYQSVDFEDPIIRNSKILLYLTFIQSENKIRVKFYQQLQSYLYRSKSKFESQYFHSFETSVSFGLDALTKLVAYQHIEAFLEKGGFQICVDKSDEKEIRVYTEDVQEFSAVINNEIKNYNSNGKGLHRSQTGSGSDFHKELKKKFTPGSGLVNQNILIIKNSRDLLRFLSTSKELDDFTTLGVDKREFKAALHKILFTVSLKIRKIDFLILQLFFINFFS